MGIPDSDKTVGVRLWITGDSQGNDSITNNYTDNSISSMINNQVQNLGLAQAHQTARSAGFGNLVSGFNNNSSLMSRAMMNIAADGRHVSLPKIWQDSSYENNYTFTVKLSSPYGSHKAIQKFIAEPLLRLVCLASSSSSDGLTYGLPPYMFVRAYGLTYLNLAIPQSLQITRGDHDRINKDRQPLDIIVNLVVTSAIPGFAALTGAGATNDQGGMTEGLVEDIQLGQMSDENVYDWDKFAFDGSQYDDPTRSFIDHIFGTISANTTGPALNTVGGILKSLMPSPSFLASKNASSDSGMNDALRAVDDSIRNWLNGFVNGNGDNGAGVARSSSASAPVLNDQFRQNIDSIGLGSVMNPFLDKLV